MTGLLLAVMVLGAAPPAAPPEKPEKKAETVAAMHTALHAVIALQPYLASPAAFRDRANAAAISSDLDALAALKHRFTVPGKQDATLETLAGVFGTEVERARTEFKQGTTEATRARLKSLTSLCFACHSRERAPQDFSDAAKVVEGLNLEPLRQAEFYATTRQFDLAIQAWDTALAREPKSDSEAFEQAGAMRQYVAVLVRVKDDRAATVAALTKQLARKGNPPFMKRLFTGWLEDAKAWGADPFDARTAPPATLLAKSRALLEASGAMKTSVSDENTLIVSLRASGYLHAALSAEPNAPWRGEALYLLGVATAATLDPLLWELDGMYLEACVRQKPHSEVARRCVDRLHDRIWIGWTGSGGTRIPPDLIAKLAELKELAR